jgi:mannitol/fructose-specific phosphotransferase system IIA component (Ntr-type)
VTRNSHQLPTLSELLPPTRISLGVEVSNWREAIVAAGKLLVETDVVDPGYVDAMIRIAEELGPYIVIAPHIALPHARPEDGAKGTGLSLVKLKTPVDFGHEDHDPVYLVFGLAAEDKELHVRALRTLAEMLSTKSLLQELMDAYEVDDVYVVIQKAEDQQDE